LKKIILFHSLDELECENPLEANILLSLAGVKSIMSNQWNSTLAENSHKFQSIFSEFLDNRQSCGEIVRYRVSPHIKNALSEVKKEEDKVLVVVDKTKVKEALDKKKESEENTTLVSSSEKEEEEARKNEEEMRQAEFMRKLERLKMENLNMVCYGIPDIYMSN